MTALPGSDQLLVTLFNGLAIDGRLFKGDPSKVGMEAIKNGSNLHLSDLMVIFGALLTLMAAISLVGWLRQQKLRPHGLVVFNRLARELGLGWLDRRLLLRLGHGEGRPGPLALMLCPGTLGHFARTHARQQPPRRGFAALARAASIRRHLFGADPE